MKTDLEPISKYTIEMNTFKKLCKSKHKESTLTIVILQWRNWMFTFDNDPFSLKRVPAKVPVPTLDLLLSQEHKGQKAATHCTTLTFFALQGSLFHLESITCKAFNVHWRSVAELCVSFYQTTKIKDARNLLHPRKAFTSLSIDRYKFVHKSTSILISCVYFI